MTGENQGMKRFEPLYAPLAQLVEQLTLNQWVLGSSPRWCTKFPVTGKYIFARCGFSLYAARQHSWPVGQAVKTPASHAGNTSSILVRVT